MPIIAALVCFRLLMQVIFVLVRSFWRRHKKKIFVTFGIVGSGYVVYKLYDGHRRRLAELESDLAAQRENEERIKAQLR